MVEDAPLEEDNAPSVAMLAPSEVVEEDARLAVAGPSAEAVDTHLAEAAEAVGVAEATEVAATAAATGIKAKIAL